MYVAVNNNISSSPNLTPIKFDSFSNKAKALKTKNVIIVQNNP